MRLCKPLHGFPVTAWRLSGLHVPLSVCLEHSWTPQRRGPQVVRVDVDQVKRAMHHTGEVLAQFQQDVLMQLADCPTYDTEEVNRVLLQQGAVHFPAQQHKQEPAHEDAGVQSITRCRWRHLHLRRQFAQMAGSSGIRQLSAMFHSWRHFSKYRSLRREANRASRQARRNRYEGLLMEASECASSQNLHKLFRVVRKLAPKQPYRRMKLYGPQGEILSPDQEATSIREHFEGILQGSPPWQQHRSEQQPAVFTSSEIQSELMRIPFHKATPKHMAPGALWRAAAPVLAPKIHAMLVEMWRRHTAVLSFLSHWLFRRLAFAVVWFEPWLRPISRSRR